MNNSQVYILFFYRYPYVACEIICADNGKIFEAMRRNTNIISPLWSFLKNMKPRHEMGSSSSVVNNSVTGNSPSAIQNGAIFFSRLNIFLFNKMLLNMINFLNERVPDSIELLVNNLDLQPISELLYRFYALYNGENDILEWLKEGRLYEKLLDQMIPEKGADLHVAVSQFIKGLFSLPFPDSFPRNQIIQPFLNPSWLIKLLKNVFTEFEEAEDLEIKGEMEQSSVVNGLQIISSILKASRDFDSEGEGEENFLGEIFVSNLIENFETFFDILKRGNFGIFHLTSGKVEIFGRIRLEIVKMFSEILICLPLTKNCENFIKKFMEIQILPLLLDFFFQYKQNNLLHEQIVEIIKEVFTEDYEKTPFNPLIDQILKEYNLRQRIIDAQRENDSQVQKPHGNRLAFMGHLTLISEFVINWETNPLEITKSGNFIISPVPEESWREYTNKTFRETRLKDKKVLGGIKPPISMHEMISSSEDSGDELLNYNSVFRSGDEEQMARYFCQQLIGNFPEQFLYAEESEDSDDDMEIIFSSEVNRSKSKNRNVKSIEIPILMPQDDFDAEMFDNSFTSSLLSDSEEESGSGSGDDDEDYEM